MERVNHYRPHRAVIRCKAKMQLLKSTDGSSEWAEPEIDTLLEELAATLFQSNRYWAFYQQCHSKQDARGWDDKFAKELAEACQHILNRRHDPLVQSMNALL